MKRARMTTQRMTTMLILTLAGTCLFTAEASAKVAPPEPPHLRDKREGADRQRGKRPHLRTFPQGDKRRERGGAQRGIRNREFDPDGPGPRFRGRRGPRHEPMPEAQRDAVLAFVEEHFPEMHRRLAGIRHRPALFEHRLRRIGHGMRELMETMKRNPELGESMIEERKLDMRIRRTVMRYRDAEDPENKEQLMGKLRDSCANIVDLRFKRHEMQIEELEQRLARLKARHERAAQRRDEEIEKSLTHYMEWRPPHRRDRSADTDEPE